MPALSLPTPMRELVACS